MQKNKYLPLNRGNCPLLGGSLGQAQFSSPPAVASCSLSAQGRLKLPPRVAISNKHLGSHGLWAASQRVAFPKPVE